jgi:hypothetical protein
MAVAVAVCVLAAALGCSRGPTKWEALWRLQGGEVQENHGGTTFGLNWGNDERTRGEFGFFVGLNGPLKNTSSGTWEVRGSFTAELLTPDYCGRAKWPTGSECFLVNLRPRADLPARELQRQLDDAGLPDGQVRAYLMYVDGKTKGMSLVRRTTGAPETLWSHVSS